MECRNAKSEGKRAHKISFESGTFLGMKHSMLSSAILSFGLMASFTWSEDTVPSGIPQLGDLIAAADGINLYKQSGTQGPVDVLIDDLHLGIAIRTAGLFGTDLAIWNPPDRYEDLKPALVDAGYNMFRFPNGSLSNEYHWNGSGKYDSTGLWSPDAKNWTPGFLGESKWRGTTKNNYGFKRASHVTDGDTVQCWWGALYDSQDPPWVVLDLGEAKSVDSLEVIWGSLRPKAYTLAFWDSSEAPYPYPHQLHVNHWKPAQSAKTKGSLSSAHFAPQKARYWAVRFQSTDLSNQGVQVREVTLFNQGQLATKNINDANQQTKVWGISTRAGDFARTDWTGIKWDFEKFMEYVKSVPDGRAVVCVNVATGTPEEAAAWVHYANRTQGYQVLDWQIGNENDGDWEEAGPLSARQYAARFLAFSKAMKAADPRIHIHGPLHSSDEFNIKGDGLFTGRSWMESFLKIVGEAEKHDRKRYLDVVDFHTYPYWKSAGVEPVGMLAASARPGPWMDTLSKWMDKYLEGGNKRELHMSEFSSTVVGSAQTLQAVQATDVAHLLAQFVTRFGDRGHALPWDTYGGLQTGPDGSMGSLRMANPLPPGQWSNWGHYLPSSQYYGLMLADQYWIRDGLQVAPVSVTDSVIRAFALSHGDTTHLLLINMADRPMPVQVHRSSALASSRQIFSFGSENFKWNGSDANAFADPGMGPWSNRLPAGDTTVVNVPPLGMMVVQWGAVPQNSSPLEALHLSARSTTLLPGDTLVYWGTLRQRGGSIVSASLRCPPFANIDTLRPVDGQFGGELEGIQVRIPIPANTKPGNYRLGLEAKGLGENGNAAEVLPFRVRGAYRTTMAWQNFDGAEPTQYTYAHGSNSTNMEVNFLPGQPPLGGSMQAKFHIEQPTAFTWPNFAGVHLPITSSLLEQPVAGIVFDYATQHSSENGYFELLLPTTVVTDYCEFQYRLKNTHGNWVRDTVLWSEMAQEDWGKQVGALQGPWIKELEFRARAEGNGEIRLDNIYLLSEEGTLVPMPQSLRRMR